MKRLIVKENISDWYLINGDIQCSISKVTGSLTGYWNLSTQEKYIEKGNDWYEVESRDLNPVNSSEKEDRVINVFLKKVSPKIITISLSCHNPVLSKKGISLTKRYSFKIGDNKLSKEVSFINSSGNKWLIRWFSQVELTHNFRKGGDYYTPWSGPGIPAETIQNCKLYKDLTNPGFCDHRVVAFTNIGKEYGIAHYKFKVRKNYSYFLAMFDKDTLCYNPTGWSFCVYGDFLLAKDITSAEVHYMLYKKDISDFLRQYNNLPEITRLSDYSSPEWLKDVKLVMFPYPAGSLDQVFSRVINWGVPSIDKDGRTHVPPEGIAKFHDLSRRMGTGYIMVPFYYWPYEGYYGDLPTDRHEDAMMSKHIGLLQKRCPQIKVSLYTITWFIDERTNTYRSHPDWVIRGKDGYPTFKKEMTKATSPPVPLCLNQILASKRYFLERVKSIMKKFNLDWFYMDWSGPAIETPDWGHEYISTWWEWYRFYQDIRKGIRRFGDNKAFFTNYPNAIPADCTFIELPHDWKNLSDTKRDWRVLSDYLEIAKLWQRNGRWVCLLYWRHDMDISPEPAIDKCYVNYLLTFGFMPNFPAWIDYEFLLLRIPYLEAAFQLRNAKLIDADISPHWRREETNIEAYTLSLDKARLIPVINHNKEKARVIVSADRDNLNMDPDRFTYTWLMKVKDASAIKEVTPIVIDSVKLFINKKLNSRIAYRLNLKPEELNILMITQVPGFVYSVNGQRTQILLPSTLGVDIKGQIESRQNKINLIVNSEKESCEILVIYPFAKNRFKLYVDGKEIGVIKQYVAKQVFLKVLLSKGRHTIEARKI